MFCFLSHIWVLPLAIIYLFSTNKGKTVEILNLLESTNSPSWFSEFFPFLIPNFFGGAILGGASLLTGHQGLVFPFCLIIIIFLNQRTLTLYLLCEAFAKVILRAWRIFFFFWLHLTGKHQNWISELSVLSVSGTGAIQDSPSIFIFTTLTSICGISTMCWVPFTHEEDAHDPCSPESHGLGERWTNMGGNTWHWHLCLGKQCQRRTDQVDTDKRKHMWAETWRTWRGKQREGYSRKRKELAKKIRGVRRDTGALQGADVAGDGVCVCWGCGRYWVGKAVKIWSD